jgi:hypothetical protein
MQVTRFSSSIETRVREKRKEENAMWYEVMTGLTHHARPQRIRSLQYHEVQLLLRHIVIMLQGFDFCQPSASSTKPIAKHKQITALALH